MRENKRERVSVRERRETGKNTMINDQAKHKLWCGNN